MAIGTTWDANTWGTNTWEDNSWGEAGEGNPENLGDATTLFTAYLAALRAASPGKDITTLVANDVSTIRTAQSDELDDYNTMYTKHLS
jgi:hypothetical protein